MTEEPAQPIENSQAEETARCKPEVEKLWRRVEEAMREVEEEEMMERKAKEAKREAWEARLAQLNAEAEDKAEAAECEAEATRVLILQAVTEPEKTAARKVYGEACAAAKSARWAASRAAMQEVRVRSQNQWP
jgi:hypothetical protein